MSCVHPEKAHQMPCMMNTPSLVRFQNNRDKDKILKARRKKKKELHTSFKDPADFPKTTLEAKTVKNTPSKFRGRIFNSEIIFPLNTNELKHDNKDICR